MYVDQATLLWNNYPGLFRREEDLLKNICIHNPGTWLDGELVYEAAGHEVDYCKSLAEGIGSVLSKLPVDEESLADLSRLFDTYAEEYKKHRAMPVYAMCLRAPDRHSAIRNIPDDITEDWARAVIRACDWLDSITREVYFSQNVEETRRQWVGACWEDELAKVMESDPAFAATWKAKEDHLETIPDWFERAIASIKYDHLHDEASRRIGEALMPRVLAQLQSHFDGFKEASAAARQKVDSIYPGLAAHAPLVLSRDVSRPEWYVPDRRD